MLAIISDDHARKILQAVSVFKESSLSTSISQWLDAQKHFASELDAV